MPVKEITAMPKISVIVPVYKVEKYIEHCVDSILAQSFEDFELILVDDGSPDNCGRICDEYAEKDSRVHVIHKENGGLSDARNAGIEWAMEHSDSRWLAFVDSDDWVASDYLKKLFSAAEENGADLAICDFKVTNEEGTVLADEHDFSAAVISDKGQLMKLLYRNWRLSMAWCKLYKRSLFEGVRYDVGKLHEDEFIIHKLFAASDKTVIIEDEMYYYRQRSSSITGEKSDKLIFDSLEAHIKRYHFCRERDLPIDPRFFTNEYLCTVAELSKRATRKNGYKRLIRKYCRLFLKERKLGGLFKMIECFGRRLFKK